MGDAQEAVGPFAAADLFKGRDTQFTAGDTGGAGAGHEFGGLGAAEHGRAEIDLLDLHRALQGAGELAETLDQE